MPDRCPPLDCANLQQRELEADNDISRTGVLVGFVGTGYVLLLVLLLNYLISYDPERRHIHPQWPDFLVEPDFKPNPIDASLLGWAHGKIRRAQRLAPDSWSAYITSLDFPAVLRKSILNLCDVQMVTGLTILVSGFMVMGCGLSSYHWQIMVYLAWFSAVSHMSSLTSIRDYLSTPPWQRSTRFLVTIALIAMLITAIIPMAYFQWSADTNLLPLREVDQARTASSSSRLFPSNYTRHQDLGLSILHSRRVVVASRLHGPGNHPPNIIAWLGIYPPSLSPPEFRYLFRCAAPFVSFNSAPKKLQTPATYLVFILFLRSYGEAMFITLRSSGGQNEAGRMEQVARRNAGPRAGKDRVRPSRRPACVTCQTKKLRCTGSPRNSDCDRCRARLIECVFPTTKGQDIHHTHSSQSSGTPRLPWQDLRDSASRHGADGPNLDSSKPPQQPAITTPGAPASVDSLESPNGNLFNLDLVDGLDMDMDELNRVSPPFEVQPGISSIISGSSDTHQPNKSPQDTYNALDSSLPSALAQANRPASQGQSCSCLSDLARVVQQLDDDEFHITTMSLDQVLQLQKWLVFQCCQPLDCSKCPDLSTIHTLRLIICDRLTEMFECIHLRIKRAGAIMTGQGSGDFSPQSGSTSSQSPDSHSTPSHHSSSHHPVQQPAAAAAVDSGPSPAQLFCGSSGRAANTAACNPLMFSDGFRTQYSDEEQVYMIRALLRLQVRNFQKLLSQLERTSQVAASQARRSKVTSMMARLSKAAADIERALRVVVQGLSFG